jgi:hypothetical protein
MSWRESGVSVGGIIAYLSALIHVDVGVATGKSDKNCGLTEAGGQPTTEFNIRSFSRVTAIQALSIRPNRWNG